MAFKNVRTHKLKSGHHFVAMAVCGLALSGLVQAAPSHSKNTKGHSTSKSKKSVAKPRESKPLPIPAKVTKLITHDLKVGTGARAVAGKSVAVHYRGTLTNGSVFDESYKRGQPFEFNLGAGQVIQGWDKGVAGMKVGGKRQLIIPASMGYGAAGAGGVIPPNATLVFTVELLGVK
jgi:FKBP-type peptidyl-prolyl cis-trans isomerase